MVDFIKPAFCCIFYTIFVMAMNMLQKLGHEFAMVLVLLILT
jgi:hypothetical protein